MVKNKKPDFKKNVVKAGKKLPKHLNETRPELKAKKIQIKSTIDSDDPIKSLANQSINSSKKIHYLSKLNRSPNFDSFLNDGEHIPIVSKYLIDANSCVRDQTVLYLAKYINYINQNKIEPPLPTLTIILKIVNCGLTHINQQIRKNSINILGNIIENFASTCQLDSQLIHIFLTLINSHSAYQMLDKEYYRILWKYMIVIKKRCAKLEEVEFIEKVVAPKELIWNENADNYLDLNQHNTLDDMFPAVSELNFTFQNCSNLNVIKYNEFMETVHNMVIKDIKTLIGNKPSRVLSYNEVMVAISPLKIAKVMNYAKELFDYWGNKPPLINISDTPITKEIQNRSNEINRLIMNLNKI